MRIAILLACGLAVPAAAQPTQPETRPAPPNAPPPPGLKIERQPDARLYYPARERKARVEGSAALGLIVRYDGIVTGCRVEAGSGSAALDAAACKLARDLRYQRLDLAERFPKVEYGCCARVRIDWAAGTAKVSARIPPRPPRFTNRDAVFGSADYPPAALRAGASGTVAIRLAVSETGAVTGCAISRSSGFAILDEETCRLATARAQVTPATDADGKPVPGELHTRMTWKLAQ